MASEEHIRLIKKGKLHWNEWCGTHQDTPADLSDAHLAHIDISHTHLFRADLSGADLHGADLNHATLLLANLQNADLRSTNLSRANLRCVNLQSARMNVADLDGADLDGASLENVQLDFANLSYARLCNTNLRGANLSHARLDGTNMDGADLRGATIQSTLFDNIDLRTVTGLAEVIHIEPSPVTLYRVLLPQDGSAQHFLRNAGIPDEWIDLYQAQMMSPIQYHTCFISYSSKDDILARRLLADLQAHGVRCYFAPKDMKIGEKIRPRINEAIHLHDKLLLILSEHSLASSWVEDEVEAAFEKERRQLRDMLFPICIDNAIMETKQAWAAKMRRQRHIGDFTQWTQPQEYEQAFLRLLRDLKKADE